MPAYRSDAEGEIRDAVVAHLRQCRPAARVIHEINVSTYGPNRIDLIAVSPADIVAVEIKSAKDKLDRLSAQIAAMRGVAHNVVAAIHEKFLVEKTTNEWAAHSEREGVFYLRGLPEGLNRSIETWVYPQARRVMKSVVEGGHDCLASWRLPDIRPEIALPESALDMLWRDELFELCGGLRVSAGRRATMPAMIAALRWHCSGKELTRGICRMLRTRTCVEADPVCEAA